MTSPSILGVKSDSFEISSEDGEDKKFVSQAVAFVIGHARNGFVALCASVAALLKEQAKLKQEVESLQKEIVLLKQDIVKIQELPTKCIIKEEVAIPLKIQSLCKSESIGNTENVMQNTVKIQELPTKLIKKEISIPLKSRSLSESEYLRNTEEFVPSTVEIQELPTKCIEKEVSIPLKIQSLSESESLRNTETFVQNIVKIHELPTKFVEKEISIPLKSPSLPESESIRNITNSVQNTSKDELDIKHFRKPPYRKLNECICKKCEENINEEPLVVPLNKKTKVIIQDDLCGVVHYVGHIDSLEFPEIYVGVEFSEAIGNSDGSIDNKVYFSTKNNCAVFVPLSHVCCVVENHDLFSL